MDTVSWQHSSTLQPVLNFRRRILLISLISFCMPGVSLYISLTGIYVDFVDVQCALRPGRLRPSRLDRRRQRQRRPPLNHRSSRPLHRRPHLLLRRSQDLLSDGWLDLRFVQRKSPQLQP